VLTGLADGRIQRIDPGTGGAAGRVRTVARTGGRPLGLEWLPDGRLLVCDAERGLLAVPVDPQDGAAERPVDVLVAAGSGLSLANNAAVAADGTVYFTDSSRRFALNDYLADLYEHSGTGRLLRRDPDGTVEQLLGGLQFGNGVALAPDGSFVLVAETGAYRVLRVWLTGPKAGDHEVFAELPGFPDNLSYGDDGLFWVALPTRRDWRGTRSSRRPGSRSIPRRMSASSASWTPPPNRSPERASHSVTGTVQPSTGSWRGGGVCVPPVSIRRRGPSGSTGSGSFT